MGYEYTEDISLLFPQGKRRASMTSSSEAFSDLALAERFPLKSASVGEFFTSDPEVVSYRIASVRDVMDNPELLPLFRKCVPILSDIADIRRLGSEADATDEYIYSITEVELYMSLLELLSQDLLPLKDRFASEGMKALCKKVEELSSSDGAKEINARLEELTYRVREIKSVTLGLNLDSRLFPESAGLVSVNNEPFRSGQTLDRLIRLDFKPTEYTYIEPLVKAVRTFSDPAEEGLKKSVLDALGSVFKSSFKSWRRIVQTYVLENTSFLLSLLPEIEFLTLACQFLKKLGERGVTLCEPKIVEGRRVLSAKGLVNPDIALKTDGEMVPNDVMFSDGASIFVVTGPNRGGKSVFTAAVGQAVMTASLGLPVCAESFEMSPCDNVFCHFPGGDEDTVDKGMLPPCRDTRKGHGREPRSARRDPFVDGLRRGDGYRRGGHRGAFRDRLPRRLLNSSSRARRRGRRHKRKDLRVGRGEGRKPRRRDDGGREELQGGSGQARREEPRLRYRRKIRPLSR